MSVVYYGNYLTYFEVGRVEYLRQQGTTIAEINAKLWIPVVEASVKYVRPARLDMRPPVEDRVDRRPDGRRADIECQSAAPGRQSAGRQIAVRIVSRLSHGRHADPTWCGATVT